MKPGRWAEAEETGPRPVCDAQRVSPAGPGTRGSWQGRGDCIQTIDPPGAQSALKHQQPPGQALLLTLRKPYRFPKSHQHPSQGLRHPQGGRGGTGVTFVPAGQPAPGWLLMRGQ